MKWATNCGGRRPTFFVMESTNCGSAFKAFTAVLYFFHGTVAAVISHGLIKERAVPSKEIDRAVERKKRFEVNPVRHTYQEA